MPSIRNSPNREEQEMKEKQERMKKANQTYCDGHEQEGMKICSWEKMPGWQKFLKGEITETELSSQAKEELAELDQAFGKYLKPEKKSAEPAKEDVLEQKAKIANKIYRKACVDSGRNFCFFKNFTAWQEFVQGTMKETEFYGKALEEIRKIAAEQHGEN